MRRCWALLALAVALDMWPASPLRAQDGAFPAGVGDGELEVILPAEEDLRAGPEPATISPEPPGPKAPAPEPPGPAGDALEPAWDPEAVSPQAAQSLDDPLLGSEAEPDAATPPAGSEEEPAIDASAGEPEEPPAAPNPFFSLTLDALEATRRAPLFTPSRTAPAVEPPPEPDPVATEPEPVETAAAPPPLQLIGIVVAGTEEVAMLSDTGSGETVQLHPGEDYQGWTLRILDGQSVELTNGDQTQKLTMFTEFPDPPVSPDIPQGDPDMQDPAFSDMNGEPSYGDDGEPIYPERSRRDGRMVPEGDG